jgi:branched-chain amino acid aminotransferase
MVMGNSTSVKNPPTAAKPASVNAVSHEASPEPKQTQWVKVWDKAKPDSDKPIIFVNGYMMPKTQAMVSVYDHGLLYGDGVFEGIRVYQGRIFKCEQHIERLYKCAEQIRMTIPVSKDDMRKIQYHCIEANGLIDGYIRLVVSRGFGTLGLDPRRCPVPGVICIADQIRLFPAEAYEQGMRVIVARRPKTPVACLDPRIKSLNYLNNILAKCEAIDFGCDEVIMTNLEGQVTEGSGDNLFVVKGGKIFTPPCEAGALEGITRGFVVKELAPMCGWKVEEKNMRLEEVLAADEVFLTGTAAEIIGVTQIDQHDGHKNVTKSTKLSASEGPMTKKMRLKFREIVSGPEIRKHEN